MFIYINMLIFIFNMLPIYPLDGGRIIKYILSLYLGKKNGAKITNIVSNIFVVIITILIIYFSIQLKNVTYTFALIYIIILTIKENKKYKIKKKMYEILENNIAIK